MVGFIPLRMPWGCLLAPGQTGSGMDQEIDVCLAKTKR